MSVYYFPSPFFFPSLLCTAEIDFCIYAEPRKDAEKYWKNWSGYWKNWLSNCIHRYISSKVRLYSAMRTFILIREGVYDGRWFLYFSPSFFSWIYEHISLLWMLIGYCTCHGKPAVRDITQNIASNLKERNRGPVSVYDLLAASMKTAFLRGYYTVWCGTNRRTFQGSLLPPSSG